MPHSAQMAGKSAAVGDAKAAGTDAPARGLWPQAPKTTASCEVAMARCETCGNDYDKAFQVGMNGTTHTFDSFECAIHALAPTCENCGIRPRTREGRHLLLLRALRRGHWRNRPARPHRRGGVSGIQDRRTGVASSLV